MALINQQDAAELVTRYCQEYYNLNPVAVIEKLMEMPAQPEEYTIEMQEADIDETMKRLRDARVTIPLSVQPEIATNLQPTCNQLATDCISRQAAIEKVRQLNAVVSPISDDVLLVDKAEAMTELMVMPSAEPDIIACGDCKHWICHDRRCGYWNHGVKPLDWCCHGERKTDE